MTAFMDEAFLRYALELAMIVPASFLCLLPLRHHFAGPPLLITLVAFVEEAFVIFFGAFFGLRQNLPSVLILAISMILFFPSLMLAVQISLSKLVFCFSFSVMLCVYATLLTVIISAPWEQDKLLTFSPRSSILCLLITAALCVLFFRTLKTYFPDLFSERQLDRLWLWGILLTAAGAVLFLWQSLPNADLADDRGLRIRFLSMLAAFPITVWLLFRLLWWFARKLREETNLTQENNILRMESKRFGAVYRYLSETRTLRHDFRQHLRVLSGLAHAGKTEELTEYLNSLEEASPVLDRYCANPTIDALAAHYSTIAEQQNTAIDWALDLPENLHMRVSDFCAILGNLVENALQAVEKLPSEQRHIQVIARMLSDQMLGLTVENPYTGKLRLRSDGLPATRRNRNHGIGLQSVAATVKRYDGTLDLDVSGGFFKASILMYPHETPKKQDSEEAALSAVPLASEHDETLFPERASEVPASETNPPDIP